MSYKNKIIYAFIDSQNLNLGVKSLGWVLDFAKFRIYLSEKYNVKKAYLFIGYVQGNDDLYTYLKNSEYILVFKETVSRFKNKKVYTKGNVDAELVLQVLIELNNYDKAIVVSGDGDFSCLIRYLDSKNKLYKIMVPNKKYSSLLRKYAKYIVNIGEIRDLVKK